MAQNTPVASIISFNSDSDGRKILARATMDIEDHSERVYEILRGRSEIHFDRAAGPFYNLTSSTCLYTNSNFHTSFQWDKRSISFFIALGHRERIESLCSIEFISDVMRRMEFPTTEHGPGSIVEQSRLLRDMLLAEAEFFISAMEGTYSTASRDVSMFLRRFGESHGRQWLFEFQSMDLDVRDAISVLLKPHYPPDSTAPPVYYADHLVDDSREAIQQQARAVRVDPQNDTVFNLVANPHNMPCLPPGIAPIRIPHPMEDEYGVDPHHHGPATRSFSRRAFAGREDQRRLIADARAADPTPHNGLPVIHLMDVVRHSQRVFSVMCGNALLYFNDVTPFYPLTVTDYRDYSLGPFRTGFEWDKRSISFYLSFGEKERIQSLCSIEYIAYVMRRMEFPTTAHGPGSIVEQSHLLRDMLVTEVVFYDFIPFTKASQDVSIFLRRFGEYHCRPWLFEFQSIEQDVRDAISVLLKPHYPPDSTAPPVYYADHLVDDSGEAIQQQARAVRVDPQNDTVFNLVANPHNMPCLPPGITLPQAVVHIATPPIFITGVI
jgi:hypothetical protein